MTDRFPDTATVWAALSSANRAPSAQNSQPWQWRVGVQSLHLYATADPRRAHTDFAVRDLILSCGATLHHCVVALAALGWQAKVRRFPDPSQPEHLAALELRPYAAADLDITLAAAIPRRRTDRRHYSSWPVPRGDIALMGARAARAGVTLRRVDAESPVPLLESGEDEATVLALGTVGDDRLSWLRAGEATSIVLLTATTLGLASCPVTEPLELAQARETLRRDTFGAEGHPQMLLRIGWAPIDAEPLPSTPRRDLAEVVAELHGSSLA